MWNIRDREGGKEYFDPLDKFFIANVMGREFRREKYSD